ncbi:galactose-3-O-sulfotransferase [Nitzschia inconspicua]|uniref:Galactose-3-O-sulfotransferase n=1 Tax=Nitzschia inconspicua TaxID=303405 RepID=A0A9K3PLN7_9STRA|nr:galactose-3-O-sulfotransferase [Nitzschia inconspicua]
MNSYSMLLVVSAALVTWIVSTILNSSQLSMLPVETQNLQELLASPYLPSSFSSHSSSLRKFDYVSKGRKCSNAGENAKPKRMWVDTNSVYDGPSRVYPVWDFEHNPFPCYEHGKRMLMSTEPADQGLLFQRPEKTGTTTMVGILMRLAHNRAQAMSKEELRKHNITISPFKVCNHRAMHGTAVSYKYHQRNRKKSFLFSLIRDPTAKAISRFFHFVVSVAQIEPTDKNFLAQLASVPYSRMHLQDLVVDPELVIYKGSGKSHQLPPLNYTAVVEDILDAYDFIGITERMDESLIVLKYLLNLTIEEILYVKPARTAGSFSNGFEDRPCVYLIPSFVTPKVAAYFESPEWKRRVAGDELLYRAANKSLDRTIDALGRDRVERTMEQFKRAQAYVQEQCKGKVRSMCDEGGAVIPPKNRTCYIWGEGCDYQCLNSLRIPPELLIESN